MLCGRRLQARFREYVNQTAGAQWLRVTSRAMDSESPEHDLEQIAADLADVERALDRLDDGGYWTDELTGDELPDELLAEQPTRRSAPPDVT